MNKEIEFLNYLLQELHKGNFYPCYIYSFHLNQLSIQMVDKVRNIGKRSEDPNAEIVYLILKILNILYNDTDADNELIDNYLYDSMVTMFRAYNDDDFQVGADVIQFPHVNLAITFDEDDSVKQNLDSVPAIEFDSSLQDKIADSIFLEDIVYPNLMIRPEDFDQLAKENKHEVIEVVGKRMHDTAHGHPELVGTLDKCKFVTCKEAADRGVLNDANVAVLERDFFADHIKKGIIDPNRVYQMVCELKYDGVSVEADCTDVVVAARSRGDTGIGQATDMTPILAGYKFPHIQNPPKRPIGVKFEAIIQTEALKRFNEARNYNYKNGRTAIVGLTGANDGGKYRDFITLVPLQVEDAVFRGEDIQGNRIAEIEFLNDLYSTHACPNRYVLIQGTYIELLFQIKLFLEDAEFARQYIPFMYDGIVVSYVDPEVRDKLGRKNFINKYSMAIKFNPLKRQTTFRGYTYTVGQDGSITPMIHYDSVEFYGTIHPKSTGHSYKRFKELNLAVGDIICAEYVNDVMPYITKPFSEWNEYGNPNPKEQFPTICPVCGGPLEISSSGRSVRCVNPNCGGRIRARLVNMFSKLNIAEFGEKTIEALGKTNLRDIIAIAQNHEFQKYGFGDGESAVLEREINKLLTSPIMDSDLFGAIGFTSLASKTWELVFAKYKTEEFIAMMDMSLLRELTRDIVMNQLLSIKFVGKVSVETILNEWEYFKDDIHFCMENLNIVSSFGRTFKKQIRATGFRDKVLFEQLKAMGYDADGNAAVTKSTDILLIPAEGFTSTKTNNAPESCLIVPIEDFRANMDKYLS